MSAMISLNSLKNDNKSEISQNVSVNVNNGAQKDIKVSYNEAQGANNTPKISLRENFAPQIEETQKTPFAPKELRDCVPSTAQSTIFDYYDNILPNINNEYYNNLVKVFALYVDILNERRFKKKNGQNVLFVEDYLNIINWLAKTYITDNQDCNIKICIDSVGCVAKEGLIDSITCTYKGTSCRGQSPCNYVDVFISSPEIVNILQMMKIDKSRVLNDNS